MFDRLRRLDAWAGHYAFEIVLAVAMVAGALAFRWVWIS